MLFYIKPNNICSSLKVDLTHINILVHINNCKNLITFLRTKAFLLNFKHDKIYTYVLKCIDSIDLVQKLEHYITAK